MKNYTLIVESNMDKGKAKALGWHIPDCVITFPAANIEDANMLRFRYLSQINLNDCERVETDLIEWWS